MEPRLKFITCTNPQGLHRMAYWEWGDEQNPRVLLCIHGLSRQGRDFEEVARALSTTHRVICPDVVGRGASDWHSNPQFYNVPYYAADMVTLLAHLNAQEVDLLGTSMGGMISMCLLGFEQQLQARTAHNKYLPARTGFNFRRVILNDVGPRLEKADLIHIAERVKKPVSFASLQEVIPVFKEVAASFGPMSDENWLKFVQSSLRQEGERWIQAYDLNIAKGFEALTSDEAIAKSEFILWQLYRMINIPILVIHGEHSDLLSKEGVDLMCQENPLTQVVSVPTGHAPSLLEPYQVKIVQDFLLKE